MEVRWYQRLWAQHGTGDPMTAAPRAGRRGDDSTKRPSTAMIPAADARSLAATLTLDGFPRFGGHQKVVVRFAHLPTIIEGL